MDFSATFCRNIRYLRKEYHLTQKEMAEIFGVSPGTVARIESGAPVRLHTGMLCRVCDHFGLSADDFLHRPLG